MSIAKLLLLSSIFMIVSCTGYNIDGIYGQIAVSDGTLHINNNGQEETIKSGDISLSFDYGIYGIYNPGLIITQNGELKSKVSIPRKAFQNSGHFNLYADEIDQDFDIRARKVQLVESTYTRTEDTSCTFSGLCLHTASTVGADGNLKIETKHGFYNLCPGNRWEEREYTVYREGLNIDFYSKNTDNTIANFQGSTSNVFKKHTVLDHGSCN